MVTRFLGSRVSKSRYLEAWNNVGHQIERRFISHWSHGRCHFGVWVFEVIEERWSKFCSSYERWKAWVDKWQESMWEIEYSGEDRWHVFINRWSQSSLTISGFWMLKNRDSCSQIHEVVKSETLNQWKVLLGRQPLLNTSGFDISTVSKTRGQRSLIQNSRSREMRHNCGGGCNQRFRQFNISGFRGWRDKKLNSRNRDIVKPKILIRQRERSYCWSGDLGRCLVFDHAGILIRTCVKTPLCVWDSLWGIEESIWFRAYLEQSCVDLGPRVGGLRQKT